MNLEKLAVCDPEIAAAIGEELGRQRNKIELIASENFVSPAVMEAMGSVLTNKYALLRRLRICGQGRNPCD